MYKQLLQKKEKKKKGRIKKGTFSPVALSKEQAFMKPNIVHVL